MLENIINYKNYNIKVFNTIDRKYYIIENFQDIVFTDLNKIKKYINILDNEKKNRPASWETIKLS